MVKQLIATLLLALLTTAAQAQPSEADIATYRTKLARYVAAGYSPDDTVKALTDWYGWPFWARYDYNAGTVDFLVKAPVLGNEIRYLRTIGSVKLSDPRVLLETPE